MLLLTFWTNCIPRNIYVSLSVQRDAISTKLVRIIDKTSSTIIDIIARIIKFICSASSDIEVAHNIKVFTQFGQGQYFLL